MGHIEEVELLPERKCSRRCTLLAWSNMDQLAMAGAAWAASLCTHTRPVAGAGLGDLQRTEGQRAWELAERMGWHWTTCKAVQRLVFFGGVHHGRGLLIML